MAKDGEIDNRDFKHWQLQKPMRRWIPKALAVGKHQRIRNDPVAFDEFGFFHGSASETITILTASGKLQQSPA